MEGRGGVGQGRDLQHESPTTLRTIIALRGMRAAHRTFGTPPVRSNQLQAFSVQLNKADPVPNPLTGNPDTM